MLLQLIYFFRCALLSVAVTAVLQCQSVVVVILVDAMPTGLIFTVQVYGCPINVLMGAPHILCAHCCTSPPTTAVYGEIEFDCGHWGVFENAIDMAHIHYLHADSFGNR